MFIPSHAPGCAGLTVFSECSLNSVNRFNFKLETQRNKRLLHVPLWGYCVNDPI